MLMFPKTLVDRFKHSNKSLRYGQAFYNFAKLEKIEGQDKAFCERLYNAEESVAKAMIISRTDQTQ